MVRLNLIICTSSKASCSSLQVGHNSLTPPGTSNGIPRRCIKALMELAYTLSWEFAIAKDQYCEATDSVKRGRKPRSSPKEVD